MMVDIETVIERLEALNAYSGTVGAVGRISKYFGACILEIDPEKLYDALTGGTEDLRQFKRHIGTYIEKSDA